MVRGKASLSKKSITLFFVSKNLLVGLVLLNKIFLKLRYVHLKLNVKNCYLFLHNLIYRKEF